MKKLLGVKKALEYAFVGQFVIVADAFASS